ncbi:Cytochrome c, class I [Candidatus Sulfopaludibacter sp. SbA4]|nr:Cytochrome c, class I [Candidatus Sulfopaludibacter sp. SbA4]
MIPKRQIAFWLVAAFGATSLLTAALIWQRRNDQQRWSIFMVGDPHAGAHLFFEKDGCAHCHSVNGVGAKLAPDLGFSQSQQAGMNQIVSAMWNHAPRMWERMQTEKIAYPDLRNEDMTHLFAFLYTSRYLDERGDQDNGERLFQKKGCARCHAMRGGGGGVGPDLAALEGVDTPIRWTQAMWNHAPAMEKGTRSRQMPWPVFEGREMNDLLAYVRANCGGQRRETELLPASPDRGRKIFQDKSCIECHAVEGKGGHVGPDLGTRRQSPLSIVQFAGLMWNHSPEMWRASEARSIPRPTFEGREFADLLAYLASLSYFDPAPSSAMGQTTFAERGCAGCHGSQAEGTGGGPALRGKDRVTSITLATALWQHGPKMYKRTRELGQPWPTLNEGDVGDVVAFLNAPPERGRKTTP